MMTFDKSLQVHMISTTNPSSLDLTETLLRTNKYGVPHNANTIFQYLYWTSNEKPKQNDWVLSTVSKTVFQIDLSKSIYDFYYRKIVATTNFSLCNNSKNIHKIPTDFIDAFIKSYNNKEVIEEVMVEYTYPTYPTNPKFNSYDYEGTCPNCGRYATYMGTGDGMCTECEVLTLNPDGTVKWNRAHHKRKLLQSSTADVTNSITIDIEVQGEKIRFENLSPKQAMALSFLIDYNSLPRE